jgi:inosine-uridine nucleoside N-ribohydrolase
MRFSFIFLLAIFATNSPSFAKGSTKEKHRPQLVIVETDMGNDIDDALAFDLLYKGMDDGELKVLAIGNHKLSPTATDFIDILSTWYGYGYLPLAKSPTPVKNTEARDYTLPVCAMTDDNHHPLFARSKMPEQIENPVTLYRKILASYPDKSIIFVSLGFATELAKLVNSPADDISPLSGRELVARKAKYLSIMAGSYGSKKRAEFNVVNDIPAMQKLLSEWDAPIIQNPFELGKQVMYPASAIQDGLGWAKAHPVAEGYKSYHRMPYDRPTWDLLSVIYLTHPEFFTESEVGTISVDNAGYTFFSANPDGKHRVLSLTSEQATRLREYIIQTTTRCPKCYAK